MNSQYVGHIKIKHEAGIVTWKDTKLFCLDYDIDAERAALLISGGTGEGIGVAMLALSECVAPNSEIKELIETFNAQYVDFEAQPEFMWERLVSGRIDTFLYTYLSFSPKDKVREFAAQQGDLPAKAWGRLLRDRNETIFALALQNASEPYKEIHKYVLYPDPHIRARVARNLNLTLEDQIILANDSYVAVRDSLRRFGRLSGSVRDIALARDDISQATTLRNEANNLEARGNALLEHAKAELDKMKQAKDLGHQDL